MHDFEAERARQEAADAIKFAHQAFEIIGWLVADMRAAQVLRPQTATNILQLLTADDHSPHRTAKARDRLRERLMSGQNFQEREMKKDALHKPPT